MNLAITLLLAAVLLLAPVLAAIPDEPLWSSWLAAGVMLAGVFAVWSGRRGDKAYLTPISTAEKAFLILLGLAFLSIPARMLVQHGTGYFGQMLRGWALLATDFALFALARRAANDKRHLYGLLLAAVVGSAYVSQTGILEYLPFFLAHQTSHRVFSTSTPDFLAGYLVLLLPVTLALLLQMPSFRSLTPLVRRAGVLILGIIFVFQLVTLLTTGSRFGLVSLLVGFLVFGASLILAVKSGLVLGRTSRVLLGAMFAGVVLVGVIFAQPVIGRLHNVNDNSAAFRKWTWEGSAKMAAANPVLGTGIGTWPDLYPRYALTGFTRLAHNSYLQLADECGVPALLALLATLGLLGVSLKRGVLNPENDSRLLLCGLTGALGAGAVQNLIDSDWYVFFLGATFWTLAGLATGIASSAAPGVKIPRMSLPVVLAVGGVAAALCVLMAAQGIAAGYGAEDFGAARAWDPLNGKYAADQGYKEFFVKQGSLPEAETALRTAIALQPNSLNYKRLGTVLQQGGREREAQTAYRSGLAVDPNNLDLLLALGEYRRVSELELTPVGTVRALGEVTETKFALADAKMGDLTAKTNPADAVAYYTRAASGLEAYVNEDGSLNIERQAISGGHPNPNLDTEMRSLYAQVLDSWLALAPSDMRLSAQKRQTLRKFDSLIEKSGKSGKI
jgi:O-antigen ligase